MIDLPITENFKRHLKRVTKEIFTDYLADKGVSLQCKQCGKIDPVVSFVPEADEMIITASMNSNESSSVQYIYLQPEASRPPYSGADLMPYLYYTVTCGNCGATVSYKALSVLLWMLEKGYIKDE
ncbi:hypothetical protein RSE71_002758 [Yersinia enterocolitica]|nr:hypothetical protein [Yersinia enterocolitica]ELI8324768.1 hypothetical protein [Yersinia enterocolitica]